MSTVEYKLLSVILCDDIRNEMNAKQTLIGIYDDAILAQSFPLLMPKLCMRIAITLLAKRKPKKLRVLVSSPQSKVIDVDTEFPSTQLPETGSKTFAIPLQISPFVVASPTDFVIKLGFDQPAKKIGQFAVRAAKNEAEKKRFVT